MSNNNNNNNNNNCPEGELNLSGVKYEITKNPNDGSITVRLKPNSGGNSASSVNTENKINNTEQPITENKINNTEEEKAEIDKVKTGGRRRTRKIQQKKQQQEGGKRRAKKVKSMKKMSKRELIKMVKELQK